MLRDGSNGYGWYGKWKILNEFQSLETLWWTNKRSEPFSISLQTKYLRSLHLTFELAVRDLTLLRILQCCPALENVSAHVSGRQATLDCPDVRLPHLRDLRVRFTGGDSWIFKLKVPPILDHLEFSYCRPDPQINSPQWNVRARSLVLGDYCSFSFMILWLENEPGALKTLTLKMQPENLRLLLTCLKPIKIRKLCPVLEQVHIRFLLPSEQIEGTPGYRRRDYERILSELFSSRRHAGLPPLRFTLDGEAFVPKAARVPITKTTSTGIPIPDALSDVTRSIFWRISNASPVVKGVEWAWSKLENSTQKWLSEGSTYSPPVDSRILVALHVGLDAMEASAPHPLAPSHVPP
jgi:hypothetical protein